MQNAPKPETAADLGHDLDLGERLASLNWFAVKAVLGVLVRSMHPHLQPPPIVRDDERREISAP